MLDSNLRSMDKDKLRNFLTHGYLKVKEWKDNNNNSEYGLEACGRLKGGGPIAGAIGYFGTKCLIYGGTVAATLGTLFTSGVGVASLLGLEKPITLDAGAKAASIGSTIAVTTGAFGTVAEGILSAEAASTTVGGFLTACPILP